MSLRAAIRTGVAALWGAMTATFTYLYPDVPEELYAVWGFVWMAAIGIGEAYYDYRRSMK